MCVCVWVCVCECVVVWVCVCVCVCECVVVGVCVWVCGSVCVNVCVVVGVCVCVWGWGCGGGWITESLQNSVVLSLSSLSVRAAAPLISPFFSHFLIMVSHHASYHWTDIICTQIHLISLYLYIFRIYIYISSSVLISFSRLLGLFLHSLSSPLSAVTQR